MHVVNLDKVPKKYAGLDGTSISNFESQERTAVVVRSAGYRSSSLLMQKKKTFKATEGGVMLREPRVEREKTFVNISRDFSIINGAHQEADVEVEMPRGR